MHKISQQFWSSSFHRFWSKEQDPLYKSEDVDELVRVTVQQTLTIRTKPRAGEDMKLYGGVVLNPLDAVVLRAWTGEPDKKDKWLANEKDAVRMGKWLDKSIWTLAKTSNKKVSFVDDSMVEVDGQSADVEEELAVSSGAESGSEDENWEELERKRGAQPEPAIPVKRRTNPGRTKRPVWAQESQSEETSRILD